MYHITAKQLPPIARIVVRYFYAEFIIIRTIYMVSYSHYFQLIAVPGNQIPHGTHTPTLICSSDFLSTLTPYDRMEHSYRVLLQEIKQNGMQTAIEYRDEINGPKRD